MRIKNFPILLHFIAWLLVLATGIVFYSNVVSMNQAISHSLINSLLLAALFYGNFYLFRRYLKKRQLSLYILTAATLFLLLTWVRFFASTHFAMPGLQQPLLNAEDRLLTVMVLTSMGVMLASVFAQLLIYRGEKRAAELAHKAEQREAQINFLKAQINPHFLFNTLNNIYSLAVMKSDETPKMILKLSELLRYIIYDGQLEIVSLKKEILHIQKFIELFQMRSEEPQDIRFKVVGNEEAGFIEPMVLIPLVENCFKHCDFEARADSFVEIILEVKEGYIHFTTQNTHRPSDQQKDKVGGVGLENITKRLSLSQHKPSEIEIKSDQDIFEVKLLLSLIKNKK